MVNFIKPFLCIVIKYIQILVHDKMKWCIFVELNIKIMNNTDTIDDRRKSWKYYWKLGTNELLISNLKKCRIIVNFLVLKFNFGINWVMIDWPWMLSKFMMILHVNLKSFQVIFYGLILFLTLTVILISKVVI